MKLLAVLCLSLAAGAMGGVLYPGVGVGGVGYGGGVGVGGIGVGGVGVVPVGVDGAGKVAAVGNQVSDVARDWAQNANAATQWNNAAKNYGRDQNDYGNNAAKANSKAQATGSDYGQQAANHDNAFNAASNAASKAAAAAASANQWAQNNDANRYAKDQVWSDNNAWRNGRRNNDGVDYAYDKKYDLKDSINGGFEYGEKVNSHALDDFVDRAGAYDRNADANAARAAAADNQWAAKKSAWAQNAAAADSNKDDFARKQDSAASANGRDKDWAQKLDASQGGNRIWSDARQAASDVYNDLVNADSDYKRVAQGAKAKDVDGYGANPYAYGVAGEGGYAALPGYYPGGGADYAAAAGVKDAGSARDNAAASKLRQGDLAATSDLTKAQYIKNKWLEDRTRGYDRNQAAAADDAGFSDWASQNARTANAADAQNADAASQSARDQAAAKFNEDLWKKDEARKRLSDRDQNKRVWGNNYNNKQRGGDNWERLKYNRDQADDVFGYDKAEKKDWAQAANDNRWNAAFDANKKQQEAAQAANAAQNAQNSDWRKAAQGWNNANAAAQDNAAAGQNGFNNGAWDQDQANALYHAQAQNNDIWHKNAGRYGADAGGYYGADGNFGPGVVGLGYPAGGAGIGTLGAYGGSGYGYKG